MCTRKIVATILAAAFLAAPVAATAQPLKNHFHFHPSEAASADSRIEFVVRNTDSVEHSLKINGELYRVAPNMQRSIFAPVGTRLDAAVVLRSYIDGKYTGETVHNVTLADWSKTFDLN
jgi:hypothetical protein